MKDRFGREITYLRLSVTDRCNLHCRYCRFTDNDYSALSAELSVKNLVRIAHCAVKLGIRKIRLTGGEPLLRDNLPELAAQLNSIPGLETLAITTNGTLLPVYAEALNNAGVSRFNISLDSLDSTTYHAINGGILDDALAGITAVRTMCDDVRINMVVMRGINDRELPAFIQFGAEKGVSIRFLEIMPTRHPGQPELLVPEKEMKEILDQRYRLTRLENPEQGSTTAVYHVQETGQSIGFISPVSTPFCVECNRIRVSSDGMIVPCLHARERIDLQPALENTDSDDAIINSFMAAADIKRQQHALNCGDSSCDMQIIGG